ncbi:MAG: hypothetical protein HFJ30_00310 [Clostridia bacterium]|jgi:hypothetical protein|nr:hypothetical protein [Clostridia bacterium]
MDKELKEAIKNMKMFINGQDMSCVSAKEMDLVLNALENSIPKQVIEEKIEGLNKEEKEIYKKDIGNNELFRLNIINEIRDVLQELLERK